ncbi:MAG TPA: hypothetical protein VLK22_00480 [Candidatus Udaeobacter sp.]|nr:hypothetical protein [Candidatus Udaeobacter sp.]
MRRGETGDFPKPNEKKLDRAATDSLLDDRAKTEDHFANDAVEPPVILATQHNEDSSTLGSVTEAAGIIEEAEEVNFPTGNDTDDDQNFRDPEDDVEINKFGMENLRKLRTVDEGDSFDMEKFLRTRALKNKLGLSLPLFEVDNRNPKYEKVLRAAEKIVAKSDSSKMLVHIMQRLVVHPTVLRRLLEKYIIEKKTAEDNYIKVRDALAELDGTKQGE